MYNKLFTKILDSSVWLLSHTTVRVWITLLAAMDEDGFCQFAAVQNLANRALVTLAEAQAAVDVLEAPDPNSSDLDNEGRRIERVPGGWIVLNAVKYHQIVTRANSREKNRERVSAFRVRERSGVDARIKVQNSKCDCCDQPFEAPYSVYVVQDHDHVTGLKRGLICQSCNKVVGQIENGKTVLAEKAEICKKYLKRWCNAGVTPSETVSEAKELPPTGAAKKSVPEEKPDDDAEHMNWMQLAHKIIEETCLPENPGTFQAIAGAIKYLVIKDKRAKGAAVQYLIAQCKDAQDRSEILNRFWFDDRKWTLTHEKPQRDSGQQGTGPRPGGNRGTAANGFNREGGGKQYERPPDFTFK
jgi:Recombination endonuclease VII